MLWRRFVTGDVLLRRRFVTETFCYGDVLLGDFLSRRRFVRRRVVCASFKISGLAEVESTSYFLSPLIANPLISPTESGR